jgi:hypothetical protein
MDPDSIASVFKGLVGPKLLHLRVPEPGPLKFGSRERLQQLASGQFTSNWLSNVQWRRS